jgi:hypothetical protein
MEDSILLSKVKAGGQLAAFRLLPQAAAMPKPTDTASRDFDQRECVMLRAGLLPRPVNLLRPPIPNPSLSTLHLHIHHVESVPETTVLHTN